MSSREEEREEAYTGGDDEDALVLGAPLVDGDYDPDSLGGEE